MQPKYRWLIAAFGALALHTSSALAQYARQEVIPLESATLSESEMLRGDMGIAVTVAGVLQLPKANAKNPVVIMMHGAGGIASSRTYTKVWTDVFNAAGIGTFVIDSFTARGINAQNVGKYSAHARVPDAFAALALLAKHPLVDPARIVLMGSSHGGPAARYANMRRFQRIYGIPGVQFAAHIAVYGLCNLTFDGDADTTRPLLMLHGTADEWVPVHFCREYHERLQKAGGNVRMIEYPDSHHSFDSPAAGTPKSFPLPRGTPAWCRLVEKGGIVRNAETNQLLADADACIRRQVSNGYNETATKKAHEDVLSFLKEALK